MDEIIQVNTNDSNYYDYYYNIFLWCGAGYWLQQFDVYANDLEEALNLIVAWCERNNYNGYLIDVEQVRHDVESGFYDSEEQAEENLLYIDATTEGATKPYYIFSENLRINETKVKGV